MSARTFVGCSCLLALGCAGGGAALTVRNAYGIHRMRSMLEELTAKVEVSLEPEKPRFALGYPMPAKIVVENGRSLEWIVVSSDPSGRWVACAARSLGGLGNLRDTFSKRVVRERPDASQAVVMPGSRWEADVDLTRYLRHPGTYDLAAAVELLFPVRGLIVTSRRPVEVEVRASEETISTERTGHERRAGEEAGRTSFSEPRGR